MRRISLGAVRVGARPGRRSQGALRAGPLRMPVALGRGGTATGLRGGKTEASVCGRPPSHPTSIIDATNRSKPRDPPRCPPRLSAGDQLTSMQKIRDAALARDVLPTAGAAGRRSIHDGAVDQLLDEPAVGFEAYLDRRISR
jgi:hypothetical protein